MKKISIVGTEGAGKSVFIAALAQCMNAAGAVPRLTPDFLSTAVYTAGIWDELQSGRWPKSTDSGTIKDLRWTWTDSRLDEHLLQILDCAGQDFRAIFEAEKEEELSYRQEVLKKEFFSSSLVVVLFNLQRAIDLHGLASQRTKQIEMEFAPAAALRHLTGAGVRVFLCFTQCDRCAELVKNRFNDDFGAAVAEYLPGLYNVIQSTRTPFCKVFAVETELRANPDNNGEVTLFPKVNCASGNLLETVAAIDAFLVSQTAQKLSAAELPFAERRLREIAALLGATAVFSGIVAKTFPRFATTAFFVMAICFVAAVFLWGAAIKNKKKTDDAGNINSPPPAPPSKTKDSGKTHEVFLPNNEKLEMVRIEPGKFRMGSPPEEPERAANETLHEVAINRPYWLGKHAVTQGQWAAVTGSNPAHFKSSGKDAPVESVTWMDAMEFCKKLTAREQKLGRLPADYQYTLPTEAQWEYACRAGTKTPFNTGWNLTAKQANYNGVYRERTLPVGNFAPNPWGLHDMHGNVWEWCRDWYAKDYPAGRVSDPVGAESGDFRVGRGGGCFNNARNCRSAFRNCIKPENTGADLGFRVALSAA
jgi:formylglycine-generating enzyme required for sulfatase activity